jgi:glycosyltransferase involved in cell wall biosynthesis
MMSSINNTTLISIIIPVYNRAELVKETLDSVISQTYQNWECLVVDDGSTDNTWEVLLTYAKKDDRIKIFKREREPKGAPTCRNIGWQISKGELIIFLDSDDLIAPWALEERVLFFMKNSHCDFILSSAMDFSSFDSKCFNSRSAFNIQDPIKTFLSFQIAWQTSCTTWRKRALKKLNGWDEDATRWQDVEIHVRALNEILKYNWVSEIPDVFIRSENNYERITNKINTLEIIINIMLFQRVYEVLKNHENKSIFNKNIIYWIYDKIEFLSFSESLRVASSLNKESVSFKTNILKLKSYIILFHLTKKIPIIRGVVYSLRARNMIFPKRITFFKKTNIEEHVKQTLFQKIYEYEIQKSFEWINQLKNKSITNQ